MTDFYCDSVKLEAEKIYELSLRIENMIADGEKISVQSLVLEAKDLLSCYTEQGHMLNEDLMSDDPFIVKNAKVQMSQLKKFIKKYKNKG